MVVWPRQKQWPTGNSNMSSKRQRVDQVFPRCRTLLIYLILRTTTKDRENYSQQLFSLRHEEWPYSSSQAPHHLLSDEKDCRLAQLVGIRGSEGVAWKLIHLSSLCPMGCCLVSLASIPAVLSISCFILLVRFLVFFPNTLPFRAGCGSAFVSPIQSRLVRAACKYSGLQVPESKPASTPSHEHVGMFILSYSLCQFPPVLLLPCSLCPGQAPLIEGFFAIKIHLGDVHL